MIKNKEIDFLKQELDNSRKNYIDLEHKTFQTEKSNVEFKTLNLGQEKLLNH